MPFNDVFDSTTGQSIDRISAAAVMPGDVVEVNARLLRWPKVGNYKNQSWDEWGTLLELSRIELIFMKTDSGD
ncbi:hypothetical protein A0H81_09547 [Grifola frondosa]|uniref:Uncharacterized protein n=1 Tax=Grifola frondosa TaxID=5627 RepID=A0A1C7M076_GRIFR|nr:hypothetical protein A0H81_09547 [Grifola frondosa]